MAKADLTELLERSSASIYLNEHLIITDARGELEPFHTENGDALIGCPFPDLFVEEQRGELRELLIRCLEVGVSESGSFLLAGSQRQRHLHVSSVSQLPQNGSTALQVQDVTSGLRGADLNDLSHEMFNSILHDLSEGILVLDQEGNIQYLNDVAMQMLQVGDQPSPEDGLLQEILPLQQDRDELFETGREIHRVIRLDQQQKGRESPSLLLNFYPIKDAEGTVIRVLETLQDISGERQTADKIRQVYTRLQERVRVLSVLNKLSNDFNLSTSGDQLFPRITRTLVWGLGLNDTVSVLALKDSSEAVMELKSYFGIDTATARSIMTKPEHVPDNRVVDASGGLPARFAAYGIGSAIWSPIVVGEQVLGWLSLFRRSAHTLEPEETLIRILSENLRHFIKRWRAERLLRNKVLTLVILRRISDAFQLARSIDHIAYSFLTGVTAQQGLGFNRAFLLLVDDEEECLRGRLAVGPDSPEEASEIWNRLQREELSFDEMLSDFDKIAVLRQTRLNRTLSAMHIPFAPDSDLFACFESRTPALKRVKEMRNSYERGELASLGIETCAITPLHGTDRPFGLLIADKMITNEPLEEDDLRFLELVGKTAQTALENVQLNEELQRQLESLKRSNYLLQEHRNRLSKLEKLGAIGEMAASVAHEIRNPLVIIGGFARSLLDDVEEDHPSSKYLNIISSEVSRLEKVITELLDFAKPIQPSFRSTLLREVILDTVGMVEPEFNEADIELETVFDNQSAKVWADPDLIKHVMLNLMQNAKNAMPRGGQITIEVKAEKDKLSCIVRDTGTGIPAEKLDKIFEPFFTTRKSGTGLGLPIVQKIIQSHGGSVHVESSEHSGTTFTFRLPFSEHRGG